MAISAVTHENVDKLLYRTQEMLDALPPIVHEPTELVEIGVGPTRKPSASSTRSRISGSSRGRRSRRWCG
jgi:hypothetical protein